MPPEAWVALPDRELAYSIMKGGQYDFGFAVGMARLAMAHPGIAPAFGALFGQIMFEPGHLDRPEREMVAAVAAAAQDCHY